MTLDRHEYFSDFQHLQKDKQRKQRHSVCEARLFNTTSFPAPKIETWFVTLSSALS